MANAPRMTHLVRAARKTDYTAIRPLFEIMGHASDGLLENRFKEYVERPDHCIVIAWSGDVPIGYAWAQNYGPHLRSGQSYARIHDLAVSETDRRKGVGRELFEAITEWCRTSGVSELQWQASRSAAPFYEKLGLKGDTKSDLEEHPFYEIRFEPSN